jgi:tetratricopeptide (TPR) repeat protein
VARLALVALALAALAACGRSPVPSAVQPAAAPAGAAALAEEGDALAERGEYAAAAAKYREALELEPESLEFRFALGSALTHLGQREAAAAQFRWVARGDRSRPEVQAARRWLAQAGLPVDTGVAASAEAAPAAPEPAENLGVVKGRTAWPRITPDSYNLTLQILLEGDDGTTRGRRIPAQTRLGAAFQIPRVPAGVWRLMAQVGAVRLWDERIFVLPGKETLLELTPASSPVSPDQFPVPPDR